MQNEEVIYEGFATPSLILEGSDKSDRGSIIDEYAKTEEQDGLLCGKWSKGFQDGLIHIYLVKPVAAICDERHEWAAKRTLLKEPVTLNYPITEPETGTREPPKPKQRLVLDPETKQFRMM